MSCVTSVMLSVSIAEGPGLDHVLGWFASLSPSKGALAQVDGHAGGTKVMGAGIWAGGFNYLDTPGLIDAVETAPWLYPECVQLWIMEEGEDRFLEIRPPSA